MVEHKLQDVVRLSQRARMLSTYKPALLKAIARISSRRPSNTITLRELGAEFARLFWNQTIVFHLRQAATITKEPEVLGQIRKASAGSGVREFSRLPQRCRQAHSEGCVSHRSSDFLGIPFASCYDAPIATRGTNDKKAEESTHGGTSLEKIDYVARNRL